MIIDTIGLYKRIVASGIRPSRLILRFVSGGYEIVTDKEAPLSIALRKAFHDVKNVRLRFKPR